MTVIPHPDELKGSVPARPIQLLIVDDSVVVRRVMARMLAEDARFHVIGAVSSGEQAIDFVRAKRVDLVLLDLEMQGADGLTALPDIIAGDRNLRVVILSGNCREGSEAALKALEIGASDVVEKPTAGHFNPAFVANLTGRLLQLATSEERQRRPSLSDRLPVSLRAIGATPAAIGIGASTGGIGAIMELLAGLGRDIPVPLFITQHLPANFQALFVSQLKRATSLPVHLAQEDMIVSPGHVYVAPGCAHLSLVRGSRGTVRITYSQAASLHGAFPAVDPMFAAIATVYGPHAAGVVLSGMGRDGLAGGRSIVEAGGWLVAQDFTSSAVWGMPGSIAKASLASAVSTPGALGELLRRQLPVSA